MHGVGRRGCFSINLSDFLIQGSLSTDVIARSWSRAPRPGLECGLEEVWSKLLVLYGPFRRVFK